MLGKPHVSRISWNREPATGATPGWELLGGNCYEPISKMRHCSTTLMITQVLIFSTVSSKKSKMIALYNNLWKAHSLSLFLLFIFFCDARSHALQQVP